jgi:hypothetical protein
MLHQRQACDDCCWCNTLLSTPSRFCTRNYIRFPDFRWVIQIIIKSYFIPGYILDILELGWHRTSDAESLGYPGQRRRKEGRNNSLQHTLVTSYIYNYPNLFHSVLLNALVHSYLPVTLPFCLFSYSDTPSCKLQEQLAAWLFMLATYPNDHSAPHEQWQRRFKMHIF